MGVLYATQQSRSNGEVGIHSIPGVARSRVAAAHVEDCDRDPACSRSAQTARLEIVNWRVKRRAIYILTFSRIYPIARETKIKMMEGII